MGIAWLAQVCLCFLTPKFPKTLIRKLSIAPVQQSYPRNVIGSRRSPSSSFAPMSLR